MSEEQEQEDEDEAEMEMSKDPAIRGQRARLVALGYMVGYKAAGLLGYAKTDSAFWKIVARFKIEHLTLQPSKAGKKLSHMFFRKHVERAVKTLAEEGALRVSSKSADITALESMVRNIVSEIVSDEITSVLSRAEARLGEIKSNTQLILGLARVGYEQNHDAPVGGIVEKSAS